MQSFSVKLILENEILSHIRMALLKYGRLVAGADDLIKDIGGNNLHVGRIASAGIYSFTLLLKGNANNNKIFPYFSIGSPEIILGSSIHFLVNYIRAVGKALNKYFVIFGTGEEHDITKATFMSEVKEYLVNRDAIITLLIQRMHISFIIDADGDYLVYFSATTPLTSSLDEIKWHARDVLRVGAQFCYEDHEIYAQQAIIRTELEKHITVHPTQLVQEYLG